MYVYIYIMIYIHIYIYIYMQSGINPSLRQFGIKFAKFVRQILTEPVPS